MCYFLEFSSSFYYGIQGYRVFFQDASKTLAQEFTSILRMIHA